MCNPVASPGCIERRIRRLADQERHEVELTLKKCAIPENVSIQDFVAKNFVSNHYIISGNIKRLQYRTAKRYNV